MELFILLGIVGFIWPFVCTAWVIDAKTKSAQTKARITWFVTGTWMLLGVIPFGYSCWLTAHAEDGMLQGVFTLPMLLSGAVLVPVVLYRNVARVAIFSILTGAACFGGAGWSYQVGMGKVQEHCTNYVAANPDEHEWLRHERPEVSLRCQVFDLTFGTWEIGIFRGNELVGRMAVIATHDGLSTDVWPKVPPSNTPVNPTAGPSRP